MPKIETRINPENGKTEYFINYPVKNLQSLEELINTINSRKDKTTPIFITQPITLKNITISLVTAIHNCVFENEITIQNCTFNREFNFINNIFEKSINLKDNIFDNIKFSNSTFKYNIQIINNTFKGDFNLFTATKFENIANFNHCKFLGKTLNFTFAIFNGQTSFQNIFFSENTNFIFNKVKINGKCHFMGSKFHGTTRFSCNFNDNVIFGLSTEDDKKETEFFGKTSFAGTTFEKKVRFHHCIFHERVSFENAKFKNLIDFFDSTFEKEQQFYKVDFEDVGVFSNTHFKGETQFLYCTTTSKTYLNFESATFEKCLDLSRSNFNNNINFWNITINGDDKISEYKHYKNSFGIHKNPPSSYRLIRESYRKIKKSFSDNGDKIGEVEYNSREQNIYKKELKEITTKSTTKLFKYLFYFLSYELIFILLLCMFINYPFLSFIISGLYPFIYLFIIFCKNINDLSMLYLNKWSNNYGRSWIRGIFFTLLIGMIVFGALSSNTNLIFKFEKVGVENFIHDFIKIINILDLKPFDDENENYLFSESKDWVFYLILFIGRIFIGYGYYQTIQAFRKYGKS